jgi:hypothetical protein
MRRLMIGSVCLALCASAQAQRHCYSAVIDASQEVPPNGSTATGRGKFVVDLAANKLYYSIRFTGLSSSETMAHIYGFAPPGMNAAPIHTLPSGNPKIGVFSYSSGQESSILSGLAYVNIHSSMFQSGEIRGQILPDNAPDSCFFAMLEGAQVVPPTNSTASGAGFFAMDTSANTLDFFVEISGLSSAETIAAIHGYAPRGMNGASLFFMALGSPKIGTWSYSPADESNILAGLAYLDIHTAMFGGGEIRGQIEALSNVETYCQGKTTSQGCVPFMASAGTPSASTGFFNVSSENHIPGQIGVLLYSLQKASLSFHGGTLCVKAPFERVDNLIKATDGAPCSGCAQPSCRMFKRNFNQIIQSGVDPALTSGARVFAQYRQRDPADPTGFGDNLSDGLSFLVGP